MQQDFLMGAAGGLLIGLAGAIYLLINGRIMGVSGVLGEVVDGTASGDNRMERFWFLVGTFGGPAIVSLFWHHPGTHLTSNLGIVIVAGILVGIGTRLANGCTSGHGVCGISRLSLRGIVATVFYILAGGVTVVFFKHYLGWI